MEGRPDVIRRWSNKVITLQEASIKFSQYRRASSVINQGTGIFCWFGQIGAGGVSVRYIGGIQAQEVLGLPCQTEKGLREHTNISSGGGVNLHRLVWLCGNLRSAKHGNACGMQMHRGGMAAIFDDMSNPSSYAMVPCGDGSGFVYLPYNIDQAGDTSVSVSGGSWDERRELIHALDNMHWEVCHR